MNYHQEPIESKQINESTHVKIKSASIMLTCWNVNHWHLYQKSGRVSPEIWVYFHLWIEIAHFYKLQPYFIHLFLHQHNLNTIFYTTQSQHNNYINNTISTQYLHKQHNLNTIFYTTHSQHNLYINNIISIQYFIQHNLNTIIT